MNALKRTMLNRFEQRFQEILIAGASKKRLDMLLYDMGEVYQIHNRVDDVDPEVKELYQRISDAREVMV
ncbi:hypothetical protein [Oceanobacillus salinisoli]|uniref:hypothetical protein n=1 Tax=Oceanobacillus salinisoli TaxID=2678611 RepID=UPI0012E10613|nr:hypothetical protein [Oceanobacillus salinisoli]